MSDKDTNHLILNLVKQVKSIGYQLSLSGDESQFVHIVGDETIFDFKTFTELVTAAGFRTPSGLSTQFLKADGSVDTLSYIPTSRLLNINGNSYDLSADRQWRVAQGDTGCLISGGLVMNSSTTIDIGVVTGYIVDNETNPLIPTYTEINYPGATNVTVTTVGSGIAGYVMLGVGNVISFQTTFPTSAERKAKIWLGKVAHPLGVITAVINEPDYITSPQSFARDLFQAIGPYINNNVYPYPNGANLSFNTTGGIINGNGVNFVTNNTDPNSLAFGPFIPTSFLYRTQTGGATGSVTLITPGFYDVAGVITAIGGVATTSSIQYIFAVPGQSIIVQYGQVLYTTLQDAITAVNRESFIVFPNLVKNAILIGVLCVNKSATDLSNPAQAQFFKADKFGQIIGATAGTSVGTLQIAYNNSTFPQITVTDANQELAIKNGRALDTSSVFAVKNIASTTTFSVTGNGKITAAVDASINNLTVGRGGSNVTSNTVLGSNALTINTIGGNNTAIGVNTLAANTVNTQNTAVGSNALAVSTASSNTAIGSFSLTSNTTGSDNTGVGSSSLAANTTGLDNTAIGKEALGFNVVGNANTGVGRGALLRSLGSNNTSVGGASLLSMTSGNGNVALGTSAGGYIADGIGALTSSTSSIFIGANTRALAIAQTNQIVIGDGAIGLGSNTAVFGNTSITTTRLRGIVQGGSFVKDGGLSTQFLKADGSVDSSVYALDSNALHKTGNESFTGTKTSVVNGSTAIALTNTGNTNALSVGNTSSGSGISIGNSGSGLGILLNNSNFGTGMFIGNIDVNSGVGLYINNSAAATQNPFQYAKNATIKTWVNDAGEFTAQKIIKSGGLSTQYLMADGSVSTLTNPITGTGGLDQIAFFDSTNSITGYTAFLWDSTNKRLGVNGAPTYQLDVFGLLTSGQDNVIRANSSALIVSLAINGTRAAGQSQASIYFQKNGVNRYAMGLDPLANNTNSFFMYDSTLNNYPFFITNTGEVRLGSAGTASTGGLQNTQKMTIKTNGNILIGDTVDQGFKFQVLGEGLFRTTAGNVGVTMSTPLSSYLTYVNNADDSFRIMSNNAGLDRVTIDSVGRVGIGISIPTNYGAGTKTLSINGTTDSGFLDIYNAGVRKGFVYSISDAFRLDTAAGVDLSFSTTGSEKMRILNNGNVGIGTSSPDGKLNVVSGVAKIAQFDSDSITGNNRRLIIEADSSALILNSYASGSASATPLALQTNGGNVGIGTGIPDARLHVAVNSSKTLHLENSLATGDGTHDARIEAYKSAVGYNNLVFDASKYSFNLIGASTAMTILPSGNVGVSNANPLANLEVGGGGSFANSIVDLTTKSVFLARLANPNLKVSFGLNSGGGASGLPTIQTFDTNTNLAVNLLLQPYGGNIGIGVTATNPAEKLQVVGNILASGTITPSDRRLKSNILPIEDALEKVLRMKPVSYDKAWEIDGEIMNSEFGFIAQDLKEIFTEEEIVKTPKEEEDLLNVNYISIIAVLTKAIQEQQVQIDELKARLK